MNEEATEFLKQKGIIDPDKKKLILSGAFGDIDLAELMTEFAQQYHEEHDQGEYGRQH